MMLALLLQARPPVTPDAIRDTISRIVLEQGYQRTVTSTLLSRAWEWFTRMLRDLFQAAAGSRGTYIVALSLIALVIIVAIVRSVIVARARRQARARRETVVTADDLLAQARGLSAQGAYVEAAHLLHAALVTRLAEGRRVRPHPSKTVGDYARELRQSNDAAAAPYRTFAQTYEIVAYGDGLCDAVRFARLEQLAAPMLQAASRAPSALAA
ncbi:MAG: DUF4129 domain-containing protein [Gemmatimonadota bacterium]